MKEDSGAYNLERPIRLIGSQAAMSGVPTGPKALEKTEPYLGGEMRWISQGVGRLNSSVDDISEGAGHMEGRLRIFNNKSAKIMSRRKDVAEGLSVVSESAAQFEAHTKKTESQLQDAVAEVLTEQKLLSWSQVLGLAAVQCIVTTGRCFGEQARVR